jgi:hypothetical protein
VSTVPSICFRRSSRSGRNRAFIKGIDDAISFALESLNLLGEPCDFLSGVLLGRVRSGRFHVLPEESGVDQPLGEETVKDRFELRTDHVLRSAGVFDPEPPAGVVVAPREGFVNHLSAGLKKRFRRRTGNWRSE